jgi:hypothetical protein
MKFLLVLASLALSSEVALAKPTDITSPRLIARADPQPDPKTDKLRPGADIGIKPGDSILDMAKKYQKKHGVTIL